MALAENHRNALKAEAAAVLKGGAVASSSSSGGAALESQTAYGKPRHQFSDMLNQVRFLRENGRTVKH